MTAASGTAPLVSVLMTSYNREAYIGEAIESVLRQTCGRFELIVCDDASTDRTVAVAQALADRDPRVRVVVNDRNVGDYPNRNRAAALARGPYLKFHDSDDIMYPHCLQVMVTALESEPRAAFALSGARAWPGGASPMLLTPRLAYEREFFGTGVFQLGPASAMFRTDFFRDMGGFAIEGAASDYLFWFKACARANVLLLPGDLFYYRIHEGQELRNPRSVRDYARACGAVWRLLRSSECPLDPSQLDQARTNYLITVVRDVYRYMRSGQPGHAAALLRELDLRPGEWLRYLRRPRRSASAGTPASSAA